MKYTYIISAILAVVLFAGLLAGCDRGRERVNLPSTTDASATTAGLATTVAPETTKFPETTVAPETTEPTTAAIPETTVVTTAKTDPAVTTTAATITTAQTTVQQPVELEDNGVFSTVKTPFVDFSAMKSDVTVTVVDDEVNSFAGSEYYPEILSDAPGVAEIERVIFSRNDELYSIPDWLPRDSSYTYSICDGMLFLCITYHISLLQETITLQDFYYYDIENDKVLSLAEYLAHFSLKEEDLVERALWSWELCENHGGSGRSGSLYADAVFSEESGNSSLQYGYQRALNPSIFEGRTEFKGAEVTDGIVRLYFAGHYGTTAFTVDIDAADGTPVHKIYKVTARMPIDLEKKSGSIKLKNGVAENIKAENAITLFITPSGYQIRSPWYLEGVCLFINGQPLKPTSDAKFGNFAYEYTFSENILPLDAITEVSCSFVGMQTQEERRNARIDAFLPEEAIKLQCVKQIWSFGIYLLVYEAKDRGPCVYITEDNGESFRDAQFDEWLADKKYSSVRYLGAQYGAGSGEIALSFALENNGLYEYVSFYNYHYNDIATFSCHTERIIGVLDVDPDAPFPNTNCPRSADTLEELNALGDVQSDKRLQFFEALLKEDHATAKAMLGTVEESKVRFLAAEEFLNGLTDKRIILYEGEWSDEEGLYLVVAYADGGLLAHIYALNVDSQTGLVTIVKKQ